jgi:hypothetical protein
LTGRPTQDSSTTLSKPSQVLVFDVFGRIIVGIEAVVTFPAKEEALRTTISAGLMPTPRTPLRGMPWVNFDHLDIPFLRLVHGEVIQFGKDPTVQFSLVHNVLFLFASAYLGGLPDMSQVLKNDGIACGGVLHNSLTQHMICIPVKPLLLFLQLLQMSLCTPGSFGLQLAAQTEVAPVHLFPVFVPQELTTRGDGGSVQAQINPDHLIEALATFL